MKNLTDNQKRAAFTVATCFEFCFWADAPIKELLENKKVFLEACAIFFDHAESLKQIAFARKQGLNYLKGNSEVFSEFLLCYHQIKHVLPQYLIQDIEKQLHELRYPKPAIPKIKPIKRPTFVYLMINKRNGLHKIGKSREPKIREATLQSEEPEIELLYTWPGGRKEELEMHQDFAPQRVRGEWFKLDERDIVYLCKRMTERTQDVC